MTIGGRRLPHTGDGSRLGEESREEGLEDSERGDKGLMRGPPLPSSVEGGKDTTCGFLFSHAPTQELGLVSSSRSTLPPTTGKSNTSPAVMMRDRADTEADLGTRPPLPPGEARGFSGPGSLEPPRRRPLPASRGRGVECRAPVLLLRRRAWLRTAVSAEGTTGVSLTPVHPTPATPQPPAT